MSLIQRFAVQKWMRDRRWKREPAKKLATQVNKSADEQWADLELIFNHLDASRRGKISLRAIRDALSMVELSEDPVRHAQLSESIVSCFRASGGTVDFPQFAEVMRCRDQGREFQTLQDELTSEGLAAAKAHFANIFRREVVVRGLLDNGRSDGLMCSVYQMLFKTEGAAASSNGTLQKLRLSEAAAERRIARELELKRAAQAKQKLVESRAVSGSIRRRPRRVPSPPIRTLAPPSGDILNTDGVAEAHTSKRTSPQESEAEPLEWQPKAIEAAVRRRLRERSGLSKQDATEYSSANISIRLKKKAIREASALLGADTVYRHPTPPGRTTHNPATRRTQGLRGKAWWLGSRARGGSSTGATAADDCSSTEAMASVVSGGLVRIPPASVRRLRRRCRRRSSRLKAGLGFREGHGRPSPPVGDRIGPHESKKIAPHARGVTSRRKDAILRRTPLYGRSALARLPSWASCDNSACDPWMALPPQLQPWGVPTSASASLADEGMAMQRSCREVGATSTLGASGAAASLLRAAEMAPEPVAIPFEEIRDWETSSATTIGTIAATIPRVLTHDPHGPIAHAATGQEQGRPGSSISSSSSSLASIRKTIHLNGRGGDAGCADAARASGTQALEKEKDNPQPLPSPRRAGNSEGKATTGSGPAENRSARRGRDEGGKRGGESAVAATAKKFPPSSPWRAPRVVRCMRRPRRAEIVFGTKISLTTA